MKGEMWFKNKKMERNMECDSKTKERIKLLEKELEDLENEDKELIKKWINPFYSQEFKLREKVNLMKTFHEILKSLRHSWPDISFESIILRRCDKNNKFLSRKTILTKIFYAAIYGTAYPQAMLSEVIRRVKTDVSSNLNTQEKNADFYQKNLLFSLYYTSSNKRLYSFTVYF